MSDADFNRLVADAHARGIRILLDLVMNHTSDEHPWFQASRVSREGPFADWYLWRDPSGTDRRGGPLPPNDWASWFAGPAWTFDPVRGQFFEERRAEIADRIAGLQALDGRLAGLLGHLGRPRPSLAVLDGPCCEAADAVVGAAEGGCPCCSSTLAQG